MANDIHPAVKKYYDDLRELFRWHLKNSPSYEEVRKMPIHPVFTTPGDTLAGLFGRWQCLLPLLPKGSQLEVEAENNRIRDEILNKSPDPAVFLAGSFGGMTDTLKQYLGRLPDEREDVLDSVLDILEQRLEVGYFILGLKSLWANKAPNLERQLWDHLGLAAFDEVLLNLESETKDLLAPEVRELTMGEPLKLIDRRAEFNALLSLARHGTPCADD